MAKKPDEQPSVAAEDLIEILRPLSDTSAVLVGGQAIWFWAEYLRRSSTALQRIGPVSSADVDFFGLYPVAKRLAAAFDGVALRPDVDDATPSTAMVTIDVNGHELTIDFIGHVYGVPDKALRKRALTIDMGAALGGESLPITILHPMHCLFSRAANTLSPAMHRNDEHSVRQLTAAYHIARRWIINNLNSNTKTSKKEAYESLAELFVWARSSEHGKILGNSYPSLNPINILREAAAHQNISKLYAEKTIGPMINRLTRGPKPNAD